MVLPAEECFSPPLRPELPENQARMSNKNEPITSQVRAGCAKKLFQSPHARMVRPNWMITLTVEMIMMRTLTIQNSREKAQKTGDFGGRQPVSLHIMPARTTTVERCLACA